MTVNFFLALLVRGLHAGGAGVERLVRRHPPQRDRRRVVITPVVRQVDDFVDNLPEYIEDAENGDEVIPEGAYITALTAHPDEHGKTRHTGFVTSSYFSQTLGRTFALALVADGLNRMGEVVDVPIGKKVQRATICDAVFFDKENIRRDS